MHSSMEFLGDHAASLACLPLPAVQRDATTLVSATAFLGDSFTVTALRTPVAHILKQASVEQSLVHKNALMDILTLQQPQQQGLGALPKPKRTSPHALDLAIKGSVCAPLHSAPTFSIFSALLHMTRTQRALRALHCS